ncbi:MAG: TetR/AcrR family transcriptional regulator [Arcanobacterium sp.]|nr:TetR/AcrR family transcriptional regulator [Arcanobacterium sp.]
MTKQLRGTQTTEKILRATREEIITRGIRKTSISSITKRCGITRSLFYHYFENLDAVIYATLDDVIDDFLAELRDWNSKRVEGDIEKSLFDAVKLLHRIINNDGPFRAGLNKDSNAELYVRFLNRTARRIAHYISNTTVIEFKNKHKTDLKHIEDTFYVLIVGLTALIRSKPDISIEELVEIAAQSLHLNKYLTN